ncbi:hypothetical protein [Bacillus cereus]|uniref:hypothetical protein n=1 Tax=Bacillus cereus TaxID=1396 RepID=UPI00077A95E3|nr:hypothetical protein [Bacillus cereus]KXY61729.1 hypothetical protein AT275_17010 [Bacillus cereus]KXY62032.1 hypothetical protein AT275_18580 [Bacillus cereus]
MTGDGKDNPTPPKKLLAMYLEVQGALLSRFKESTQNLNNDLPQTKRQVNSLNSNLDEIRIKLNENIQRI